MSRLCVISPMHNEAENVERVIAAMAAQRRRPDLWVIVDDQSTDDTQERARAAARGLAFVRVLAFARPPIEAADRLAHGLEAGSFNFGLDAAGGPDAFDYIAKLDGDVVLPPEYYAECLRFLEEHPETGMVCGQLLETIDGVPRILAIASRHVHGALKLYRQPCFEAVGGMRNQLGWDAIDEIYARMNGFDTISMTQPIAEHLRPVGSVDGVLRGRARHGTVAYITHFPWYWILGRALKLARARPRGLSGAAFIWGYGRAAFTATPRVDDPAFRAFARREIRQRTLAMPGEVLHAVRGRLRAGGARLNASAAPEA